MRVRVSVQVVHIVRSAASPESAAQQLTSAAFSAGSLDNCTAVVVALQGYKAGELPADFIPSPLELEADRRGWCEGGRWFKPLHLLRRPALRPPSTALAVVSSPMPLPMARECRGGRAVFTHAIEVR